MNNFNKISEAIKYIDENISETLSVEMIAERFAFSPYYFHRLFTVIVGKSTELCSYHHNPAIEQSHHPCKISFVGLQLISMQLYMM